MDKQSHMKKDELEKYIENKQMRFQNDEIPVLNVLNCWEQNSKQIILEGMNIAKNFETKTIQIMSDSSENSVTSENE